MIPDEIRASLASVVLGLALIAACSGASTVLSERLRGHDRADDAAAADIARLRVDVARLQRDRDWLLAGQLEHVAHADELLADLEAGAPVRCLWRMEYGTRRMIRDVVALACSRVDPCEIVTLAQVPASRDQERL